MAANAEDLGPEIVAGMEVAPDIADFGSDDQVQTQEFWKRALKAGAILAGAAAAIYFANRTGYVDSEGVSP